MTASVSDVRLTVAGRTFRPVTRSTFAHQLYMMPLVRDAGLLGLAGQVKGAETGDDAEALLFRVIESPHTLALLAGVLVEADKPKWTPEDAKSNAEFFADISDPAECMAMQRVLLGLVTDFFAIAGASPAISGGSSAPAAVSSTSAEIAGTTTSASGAMSSAPSPATTRTRSRGSRTGRSAKG